MIIKSTGTSKAVLRIMDVMGNVVVSKTIELSFDETGDSHTPINISSYAQGIYIIELISGSTRTQTKLNVIR